MKKMAITILFACAFLGAGCSDSTVETAAITATATPVPAPTPTQEERAEIKRAEERKAASMPAAVTAEEAVVPAPVDASVNASSLSPTP